MTVLERVDRVAPRMPGMGPQAERFTVPRGLHHRHSEWMEAHQMAWLRAVAASAGCIVSPPELIDDGIDVRLESRHEAHTAITENIAQLRVQLKATSGSQSGDVLKVKVSRHRVREYAIPDPHVSMIVVALSMPAKREHWTYVGHRSLSLFGRSAWVNLAGTAVEDGDRHDQLTVSAPVSQSFDDVALAAMMGRIGKGEQP